MQFFFNIHFAGVCYPDKNGREFGSAESARQYAIGCARTCMNEGTHTQRDLIKHITLEVSDHHGFSDVILFADVATDRRNPRETLEKAAERFGIG